MAKKYDLRGFINGVDTTYVEMTPEEMQAEILRLNSTLVQANLMLGRLYNTKHPTIEATRFVLTHGGSHKRKSDRKWNSPRK